MTATARRPRDNPFRTERLDGVAFRHATTGVPAGRDDLCALVERFEALGRHAAVIGPEGSGKTTLLDALEPSFAARGFEVLRLRAVPGGGAIRPLDPGRGLREADWRTLLVVDGIDRLPVVSRWRVRQAARGAAGLLVTAHQPLRMPTLIECTTTPALLAALVADLTSGRADEPSASTAASTAEGPAGRSSSPFPPLSVAALPSAEALHARHRGNLRTALLELFDLCAGR